MAPTEQTPQEEAPPRRKRHWWRVLSVGSFLLTVLCMGVLAAGFYASTGRSIHAPDWLRERIEARADQQLGADVLEFGDLQVVVVDGWQPRLRMTDVAVMGEGGEVALACSQLDLVISLPELIEGSLRIKALSMAGIFATLERRADGSMALSGGLDFSGPRQAAPNIGALLKELDALLTRPAFERLETLSVQALTLRYEDALARRAWTLDGGRIDLAREGNALNATADLAVLGGAAGLATLQASYSSTIGAPEAQFGLRVEDIAAEDVATQSPALAWLSAVRAPISGSLRSGVDAGGTLLPLQATLSAGAGAMQPTEATRPIRFDAARAYFSFDPTAQLLSFTELSVDSKWVTGRAEGEAWLDADGQFIAQLEMTELALNPFELYDTPRALARASADLRMSLQPFRVELGQAALDMDGNTLLLSGDLTAAPEGWELALDAQIDETTAARVLTWWPQRLATKTRGWLEQNLIAADLRNVDFALRGLPNGSVQRFLSFDFEEGALRFHPDLPPVTEARGQLSLDGDRLVAAIDAGKIVPPEGGAIDVSGSAFVIADLRRRKDPRGQVRLESDGAIRAALSFIDQPPLSLLTKAGRGTDLAEGRAEISGTLSVPLRKGAEPGALRYELSGRLENVRSRTLVEGRSLRAGALVLAASDAEIIIGGPGTLDGIPFEAAWQQRLAPGETGEVSGTVALTQDALNTLGVGLPPGTVRGSSPAELTVSLPKGAAPRFSLSSDLRGAGLSLPPLGWSKGAAVRGNLRVAGTLGPSASIERFEISAPGLSATGDITLRPGGGLGEARFSRVTAGGWLDAPVTLVGRGRGQAPAIRVTGGEVDLREAEFGGGSEGSEGGPLTLSLDRLQISDAIVLTNFAGQFAGGPVLDGRFTARVADGPQIEGRVVPQNGRSAVRISGSNAGGVMAAAGLLKQAEGGSLDLTLLPVAGAEGTFDGKLTIQQARVKNAPAIAELLSALSIVGLLEQMSGQGITFAEVEADFRLSPDRIDLRRASAVGPSMGISMDGSYRMADARLDMQGVISPVYFLNAIGRLFARKGEGLIGFTYRLRGTASDPNVQVNPLSALTPGLFRDIFRAPPPDIPEAAAPSPDSPQALLPETQTRQERGAARLEERRRAADER